MRAPMHAGRSPWLKLSIALIVLAMLAPSAVPAPLVSSVRKFTVAYGHERPSAALASALELIEFSPDFGEAYFWGAQAAFSASQPELALQLLASGRAREPTDAGPVCWEGDALAQTGRLEEALRTWQSLLHQCAQQDLILERLADGYERLGRFAEAEEALEALVSLKPLDLTARRRLALQLVAVDPQRAEPHLKFVLENQEHPEEMLRGIVDLIESQENAEDRAYLLARIGQMLLRYGQWDMAARTLRHAVEEEPDYPQALSLLAVALINLGEDAGEELEAAAELAPEDPVNHIFRSMAFMRDGEIDAGITELETAAALDPDNPATLAQLGAAYALRGDLKLALDGYLGAAEISDHGGDFWLLLAQFCNANQYQVAAIGLPAARNAYSLDPESPAVLDAIGYAHFLLGDLPLAERFLQRAVAAHPLEPLTQYHLALLRLTQNQPKAAQAALELAIQLEPDPSLVLLAERSLRAIAP